MGERSSIFDMIGPVMIGPSSSHTAGVVRIGRAANRVLGGMPEEAEITFYNSFARTYEGHGSDRAIIAGIMDFKTDDERIKKSMDIAKENGMSFKFKSVGNASIYHPNTVKLNLKRKNRSVEVIGESLGGGLINISKVNGFNANFSANLHTLILTNDDQKGSIAFISNVLSNDECNIATMSVSRKGKSDIACMVIEMDSPLSPISIEYIKHLKWVHEVIYIPNIDL
ncbi:L-serine ammonia-lyase, iron-sulfur-dependent subunit beta [Marinigracilibium pacificum]|uniref:L-serine dehydratase n=1 Tax=Marinigracilibium pacificum TaxID=2729599 RepID=A0A848IXN0_9BACT|nr:L-serine ammonia-lyase, iron-sulfur-dependent subunit beta [Marinigracilibium pacificum]NMM48071.1 L-serine ammonia-lyase, iron-sulfur-dependent, subunit beta [Marinigracilibium pacificum]